MSRSVPCPIEFLATEIAETSRLTRELTAAAGTAIAVLAEHASDESDSAALHRLMVALQAQDRVEQRLSRLEAYARQLDATPGVRAALDTLENALVLDELVTAFQKHMGVENVAAVEQASDEVELF